MINFGTNGKPVICTIYDYGLSYIEQHTDGFLGPQKSLLKCLNLPPGEGKMRQTVFKMRHQAIYAHYTTN